MQESDGCAQTLILTQPVVFLSPLHPCAATSIHPDRCRLPMVARRLRSGHRHPLEPHPRPCSGPAHKALRHPAHTRPHPRTDPRPRTHPLALPTATHRRSPRRPGSRTGRSRPLTSSSTSCRRRRRSTHTLHRRLPAWDSSSSSSFLALLSSHTHPTKDHHQQDLRLATTTQQQQVGSEACPVHRSTTAIQPCPRPRHSKSSSSLGWGCRS